jgi:hypothetical protein
MARLIVTPINLYWGKVGAKRHPFGAVTFRRGEDDLFNSVLGRSLRN